MYLYGTGNDSLCDIFEWKIHFIIHRSTSIPDFAKYLPVIACYLFKPTFYIKKVLTGRYGPHECWADPGTHVLEKGTINMDDMSYNISGYVGTSVDGDKPDNEALKITPGFGEITMEGKLDEYNVYQKVSIDPFSLIITHEGNIAGHDFSRTITPVSFSESSIEGNYGSLEEKGKISQNDDGSIAIIRDFGPYHVEERVSFEQ